MQTEYAVIGASPPRTGLADKIRGEAVYTADLKLPDMLYARVLRSPHAHARVLRVDYGCRDALARCACGDHASGCAPSAY